MGKTNQKEYRFSNFLSHRFAFHLPQSIFAPLFTVTEKEIFSLLNWSVRLGVRTPDFHSGNTGSIPVQTTIKFSPEIAAQNN